MIDAHCHIWRPGENGCVWPGTDLPSLHRIFSVSELAALAKPLGVTGCILVQSQEDVRDTAWLLAEAANDPFVRGVVGWIDLAKADAADEISALARAHPLLCGLRPMVQDLADDWFADTRLDRAFAAMGGAGLALDALVRPQHLAGLIELARRLPTLRIVIDHAAKPGAEMSDKWRDEMTRLAECQQVYCKLSGLFTEGDRVTSQETAQIICDLFGTDRLLWGSDWPVLTLGGEYADWLKFCQALVPSNAHSAVFGSVAARVYGIGAS